MPSFQQSTGTVERTIYIQYINIYTMWDLNLIVFSEKRVSCLFSTRRTAYIVRDNAKKFTSVGLSYKDVILCSKIFYMFDVVYVKSNSISCEFSGLN